MMPINTRMPLKGPSNHKSTARCRAGLRLWPFNPQVNFFTLMLYMFCLPLLLSHLVIKVTANTNSSSSLSSSFSRTSGVVAPVSSYSSASSLSSSPHSMTSFSGSPSFDRTLSPRQIKTKYGFLRGILISPPSPPQSSSTQRPTSSLSSSSSSLSASASVPTSLPSKQSSGTSSSTKVDSKDALLTPVEAFLGVPYASPPLGSLRFMPPVTPNFWKGVRMANSLAPSCPQKLPKSLHNLSKGREEYLKRLKPFIDNQSEDCLYLNLYTPFNRELKEKLAVMFFINGESYDWGSGAALDGTILSSIGRVIVVTLNYRLGLFGFLPTTIEGSKRGNYALMDIIAALHWVHDNAAEFGGDASNITLVGHDRGAAIANLLMISPMARGLFSRVILMSGSALSPVSISSEADYFSQTLAKAVNCDSGPDSSHLLECLRTKSVDELNKVNFGIEDSFRTSFGPIVDGLLIPTDPSLLMESENSSGHHLSYLHPMGLRQMTHGSPKPVHSLLFGVVRTEAPFVYTESEEKNGIDGLQRDRILYSFIKNIIDYYQEVISLSLVNEYTDWTIQTETPVKRMDSLLDTLSDGLVVSPLLKAGVLHHKHQTRRLLESSNAKSKTSSLYSTSLSNDSLSTAKTFFYVFNHQNKKIKYDPRLGCVHGEELSYLFGAPIASLFASSFGSFAIINYTEAEISLSKTVINYFSNFAKYGNPNGLPGRHGVTFSFEHSPMFWPDFEEHEKKYLVLDLPLSVGQQYRTHRVSIWQNLIPKLQTLGKEESESFKRHLQDQQRNPNRNPNEVAFFERISLKFLDNLKSPSDGESHKSLSQGGYNNEGGSGTTVSPSSHSSPSGHHSSKASSSTSDSSPGAHTTGSQHPSSSTNSKKTTIILHPESEYSTLATHALSLTITVGLGLLILNLLIFTAVYYKLHRGKRNQRGNGGPANSNHHHQGSHTNSMTRSNSHRRGGNRGNYTPAPTGDPCGSLSRQRVVSSSGQHNSSRKNSFNSSSNSPAHTHSSLPHHHLVQQDTAVVPSPTQIQPLSGVNYQINYESEYESEGGFNDKLDVYGHQHQQQQHQLHQHHHSHHHHSHLMSHEQQQHQETNDHHASSHASVTFNDYITHHPLPPSSHHIHSLHSGSIGGSSSNSSPAGLIVGSGMGTNGLCVKYSPSPNSVDVISNTLTDDSYSCQMMPATDIYTSGNPGFSNGYPMSSAPMTRTSVTISSSNVPAVSSSSSSTTCNVAINGTTTTNGGVCDKNCLTVIQEMDDEHL